ncbi:Nn.00g086740.m01.CDS01 [Neocucurbitaria sp. VM-36]
MSAPDSAAQPGAGWDEAQCTAALAQLEQLQAQIDDLRLAIPRIIEPFHRPLNPNTFKLYAQGVIGSQNGIKDLHESWKSPETQGTFEHVRKSYAANADLAASASIPPQGWAERQQREGKLKKGNNTESVEDLDAALTEEDITRIIEDVQKACPTIKLEPQDDRVLV